MFESGKSIENPRIRDLERIKDEKFSILEAGPYRCIQCLKMGDPPWGYVVEYQDGSLDEQYQSVDGPIGVNRVVAAFTKYLKGDPSWQQDFTWGKLNPNDWSVDESVGPPRWTAMRDKELEWFLKDVFEQLGYQVQLTKASGDQGVDLIVSGGGRRIAIQVKGYANAVGNSAVQEVYAGMNFWKCQECAVITNSRFTKSAKHLADSLNCKLIDRRRMDDLMAGEHPWARSLRTADDYSRIEHPVEPRASARNQMQALDGTGSSRPLQVPTVPHPSWTSPEQNPDSGFDQTTVLRRYSSTFLSRLWHRLGQIGAGRFVD